MTGIDSWSTTPATNATIDGGNGTWAEGQLPSTVNNTARQQAADVRSAFNDLAWFNYGSGDQGAGNLAVPTVYASATTFTVAASGNLATVWEAGRRVRAAGNSTGTIFGTISGTVFGGGSNTVTVAWDSGSLSNETVTVSLGQLPVTGKPIPINSISGALGVSGRLTPTSATAILPTSVLGATTIYYTPYSETGAPSGLTETSQTLSDTTKSPAAVVPNACYDYFLWQDTGTTYQCTRGPAWIQQQTATVTIATPGIFSCTAHGFYDGQPVVFTTTGALPTGLTAGTVYFVIAAGLTANAFEVSATLNGSAVNTSGSQSGTHTVTQRVTQRGTGAGTSELQPLHGVYYNKNNITNGPLALAGLYVGSIVTNSAGTIDMNFGGVGVLGGESCSIGIWNAFNRVPIMVNNFDTTPSWNYTTLTLRPKNNSINNRIAFLVGLPGMTVDCSNSWNVSNSTGSQSFGPVGIDSTTAYVVGASQSNHWTATAGFLVAGTNELRTILTTQGQLYALPLEASTAAGTTTWQGNNAVNFVQSIFDLRIEA